ncbi:MAG: PilZ domain-containing protein [Deltaproteobacteria bacterium]|nr:PilZ domain-containing protein [Deltaproteobacteria bacterium]MBW2414298.1 PilZ domain-containing protein [Deltaproteobacteria bacterium]
MAQDDKEKSAPDRRRSKRVKHRLKLRFWDEDINGRGFTHDISVTGLLIETTSAVPIGARLHIEVELPEERRYLTEVSVVRKKVIPREAHSVFKPALGVRLVGLREAIRDAGSAAQTQDGATDDGTLRIDLSGRAALQEVYDRDIKHGALRVSTPHIPAADEVVSVTVVLPEPNAAIEVVGTVVSRLPELPGFGMLVEDCDMIRARMLEILRG